MGEMSVKEAVSLAVQALRKELQLLAFDVNVFKAGYDCPESRRAHERATKIRAAIFRLEELCSQTRT